MVVLSYISAFAAGESAGQSNKYSEVNSEVSYFNGNLSLSEPLVTLQGRGGNNVSLNLSYSSNIETVARSNNRTNPTDWLGMGWSMGIPSIKRTHNNTPHWKDDDFYVQSKKGSTHKIVKNFQDDGSIEWLITGLPTWKVTPRFETVEGYSYKQIVGWKIVNTDGKIMQFGDLDFAKPDVEKSQNATCYTFATSKTVEKMSFNDLSGTGNKYLLYPYQWNILTSKDRYDNTVTYEYQQTKEKITTKKHEEVKPGAENSNPLYTSPISYTKASYLKKVTSPEGRSLEFVLTDKDEDEYYDEHIEREEPDAFIEMYESKLLKSIILKDIFGREAQRVELTYKKITMGTPYMTKSLLSSISVIGNKGTKQTKRFYYNDNALKTLEGMPFYDKDYHYGALSSYEDYMGKVVTFDYNKVELVQSKFTESFDLMQKKYNGYGAGIDYYSGVTSSVASGNYGKDQYPYYVTSGVGKATIIYWDGVQWKREVIEHELDEYTTNYKAKYKSEQRPYESTPIQANPKVYAYGDYFVLEAENKIVYEFIDGQWKRVYRSVGGLFKKSNVGPSDKVHLTSQISTFPQKDHFLTLESGLNGDHNRLKLRLHKKSAIGNWFEVDVSSILVEPRSGKNDHNFSMLYDRLVTYRKNILCIENEGQPYFYHWNGDAFDALPLPTYNYGNKTYIQSVNILNDNKIRVRFTVKGKDLDGERCPYGAGVDSYNAFIITEHLYSFDGENLTLLKNNGGTSYENEIYHPNGFYRNNNGGMSAFSYRWNGYEYEKVSGELYNVRDDVIWALFSFDSKFYFSQEFSQGDQVIEQKNSTVSFAGTPHSNSYFFLMEHWDLRGRKWISDGFTETLDKSSQNKHIAGLGNILVGDNWFALYPDASHWDHSSKFSLLRWGYLKFAVFNGQSWTYSEYHKGDPLMPNYDWRALKAVSSNSNSFAFLEPAESGNYSKLRCYYKFNDAFQPYRETYCVTRVEVIPERDAPTMVTTIEYDERTANYDTKYRSPRFHKVTVTHPDKTKQVSYFLNGTAHDKQNLRNAVHPIYLSGYEYKKELYNANGDTLDFGNESKFDLIRKEGWPYEIYAEYRKINHSKYDNVKTKTELYGLNEFSQPRIEKIYGANETDVHIIRKTYGHEVYPELLDENLINTTVQVDDFGSRSVIAPTPPPGEVLSGSETCNRDGFSLFSGGAQRGREMISSGEVNATFSVVDSQSSYMGRYRCALIGERADGTFDTIPLSRVYEMLDTLPQKRVYPLTIENPTDYSDVKFSFLGLSDELVMDVEWEFKQATRSGPNIDEPHKQSTAMVMKHFPVGDKTLLMPYKEYVYNGTSEDPKFNFDNEANNSNWKSYGEMTKFNKYGSLLETASFMPSGSKRYSTIVYRNDMGLPFGEINNAEYDEVKVHTGDYIMGDSLDADNGWEKGGTHGTDGFLKLSTTEYRGGNKSLHVRNSYGPTVNVHGTKEGSTYIFSAWIKNVGTVEPKFVVEAHDKGSASLTNVTSKNLSDLNSSSNKSEWNFYEFTLSQSTLKQWGIGDDESDYLRLWIGTGSQSDCEFYIEDIRFTPSDAYCALTFIEDMNGSKISISDVNSMVNLKNTYDDLGRAVKTYIADEYNTFHLVGEAEYHNAN